MGKRLNDALRQKLPTATSLPSRCIPQIFRPFIREHEGLAR